MKLKMMVLAMLLGPMSVSATERASSNSKCPCEDKQILEIIRVSHLLEIDVTNSVIARLQDPTVIAYARALIAAHTTAGTELLAFVNDTGLVPEVTDLSKAITEREKLEIRNLSALTGDALDIAFLETQFLEHQLALTAEDTYWLPKAYTDELKDYLIALRPSLVSEFDWTVTLQKSLNSDSE